MIVYEARFFSLKERSSLITGPGAPVCWCGALSGSAFTERSVLACAYPAPVSVGSLSVVVFLTLQISRGGVFSPLGNDLT